MFEYCTRCYKEEAIKNERYCPVCKKQLGREIKDAWVQRETIPDVPIEQFHPQSPSEELDYE